MRIPRLQFPPADGLGRHAGERPGNTNDTDTTTTLSGGDSGDGFTRSAHGGYPAKSDGKQNAPLGGVLSGVIHRVSYASAFFVAASILRVMYHCWAIDRQLFTTQYSTRPAGNHRKKKVKMIGIIFMTFACIGSGGVGFRRCWMNMVAPMMIGRIKNGSLIDRSVIHSRNGAWRISTLSRSTQYRERNTGI